VKGQILRLRGEALARRLVRTPRCYVVSRPDGEVVVGATVEERGFDTTVTADGVFRLLEAAREVLPDVGELELVEAAARLRPGTPDNAPLIGDHDGLVWATGHHRNGVLLAPITALAVAAIVTGDEPPAAVEPFAAGRFARAAA
jgi:glycine oxidase